MLKYASDGYVIAVVGATGLVGRMMIEALADYEIPIKRLRLFASATSKGRKMIALGQEITVECLDEANLEGIDAALFSAGSAVSLAYAQAFLDAGVFLIDNSSAFRQDPDIPLIVPEVNPEDVRIEGIIANPNCSTIQSVLPLKALDASYGVNMVSYVTFQSVSGSGQKGLDALRQLRQGIDNTFYPHDIARTVIPEIDRFEADGYTKEEHKMINETRRLLKKSHLPVSATCVRVPIERGHAVQMTVTLEKPFEIADVRKTLQSFHGIIVTDDPDQRIYPVTTNMVGTDLVHVGRIRRDLADPKRLLIYAAADNIRKGAAGNAVQILKLALAAITP